MISTTLICFLSVEAESSLCSSLLMDLYLYHSDSPESDRRCSCRGIQDLLKPRLGECACRAVWTEQREAAAAAYVRWIFSFHFLRRSCSLLRFTCCWWLHAHLLLLFICRPDLFTALSIFLPPPLLFVSRVHFLFHFTTLSFRPFSSSVS